MKKIYLILVLIISIPLYAGTDFSLRDIDSKQHHLRDYIGKGPIILDFWASWCKPCIKNLPNLEKLYKDYHEQGLVILGINEDGPRSLAKVEPFVKSLGLTFPILLDENRDVTRKYNVSGFPTTILIDMEGNIAMIIKGYRPGDEELLRQKIESLLSEAK